MSILDTSSHSSEAETPSSSPTDDAPVKTSGKPSAKKLVVEEMLQTEINYCRVMSDILTVSVAMPRIMSDILTVSVAMCCVMFDIRAVSVAMCRIMSDISTVSVAMCRVMSDTRCKCRYVSCHV